MPDINPAIVQWRQSLAERIEDAAILDELESHLRDEIDRLVVQGQTPEQAVQVAIAKIGTPETLAPEFAKLTPLQTWWPIRIVAVGVVLALGFFSWAISDAADGVFDNGWSGVYVVTMLTGILLCFGVGAMANCYAFQRTMSRGQMLSWNRAQICMGSAALVLTSVGVIAGAIWSHAEHGHWDGRQFGGFIALAWQAIFLLSVWKLQHAPRLLMAIGIFGTVAMTYSFFGFITFQMILVVLLQVPALAVGWRRSRAHRMA